MPGHKKPEELYEVGMFTWAFDKVKVCGVFFFKWTLDLEIRGYPCCRGEPEK